MPGAALSGPTDPMRFALQEFLSEPEKFLSAHLDSAAVGLCILDSDLRYVAINDPLAALNGLPAKEHLGRTVRDVLGDLAPPLETECQRVLANGEPVLNFQLSGLRPTRKKVGYWREQVLPIKNDAGAVTQVCVVVVETPVPEKLEDSPQDLNAKLHQQMERLQMLLDVSNILASGSDLHQAFLKISARIRRILRQEYAGLSLRDATTGLLVRQAEDFPLGRGLLHSSPVSAMDSPGGRCLETGAPLIFCAARERSLRGGRSEESQCGRAEVVVLSSLGAAERPGGGSFPGQHARARLFAGGPHPAQSRCDAPRHRFGEPANESRNRDSAAAPCRGRQLSRR
jgi:hypothetical protein